MYQGNRGPVLQLQFAGSWMFTTGPPMQQTLIAGYVAYIACNYDRGNVW